MNNPKPAASGTGASRENTLGLISWALYDWANSAFPTLIQTFVFAAYFTRQVAKDEATGTALWGNATSLAGLIIAITAPVLGALTDQTGRRKPWMAAFTGLCIVTTALLWFVEPASANVAFALGMVVLGTIGVELAMIFYNAMLPGLASVERIGRWSGWGWGLGYIGGLACLVTALFGFVSENPWFPLDRGSAQHVRATFLRVSGWFLVFSLPLFLFTPDVPASRKPFGIALKDGLQQLVNTFRKAREHSSLIWFLVAHMIFIDGLATLFAFGGVYAAGTFDMSEMDVLKFGIVLNISAGIGAVGFAFVDDRIGGKQTILISLAGLLVSTILMLSVREVAWFWWLGVLLGLFVGPVQAASRSYLARTAPVHLRNESFGLFAFSGKATAFLGPLLVGWVTYASGSQRIGIGTILLFFIIGFVMMLRARSDSVR